MTRFLAGMLSCFLMMTGAFLLWQGRAERAAPLDAPPPAAMAPPAMLAPVRTELPAPPEATAKSREEKRFARADLDDNGRISAAELTTPRRKAFAKLDANGNGSLSFDEWAVRTLDKFEGADKDSNGFLTPAEYASTAPKPSKRKQCSC